MADEGRSAVPVKCIRQFAQSARRNAKFHSSPQAIDRSTAKNVSLRDVVSFGSDRFSG